MKGDLNENTFFNTVAMARQGSKELILVVEGDDDHLVVDDHANRRDLTVIRGVGGRGAVLAAAERAEVAQIKGVRFLIDIDYERFSRPAFKFPANVFTSTHHDAMIDIVLVGPNVLRRVIDVQARSARRRGADFDTDQAQRDAFVLAAAIAPLRIVNDRSGYGLRLDDFPFGSVSSLSPSSEEIAALALSRSRPTVDEETLTAEIEAEKSKLDMSDVRLVGDHDYFKALARVLALSGATVGAVALWAGFLGAIACDMLASTDWFEKIQSWGAENSRDVFKCPCAA